VRSKNSLYYFEKQQQLGIHGIFYENPVLGKFNFVADQKQTTVDKS